MSIDHHRIATTCLQLPLFWIPNLGLYNIKLPLNNDQQTTTATNSGFRRWSLYTCLTVVKNELSRRFVVKSKERPRLTQDKI